MKRCRTCGEIKPLYEFYAHPNGADGHLNKCIECVKAAQRKRRSENLEKFRARDAANQKSERHKTMKAVYLARWRRRNKMKYREELNRSNAIRRQKRVNDPVAYAAELARNRDWKRAKRKLSPSALEQDPRQREAEA